MKWLRILAALWVTVIAGLPASTLADDTEIYSRQVNSITEDVRPNILFMLDNSSSMLWPMRNEETGADTGEKRIDILKDALLEMLDQVNNVNVGLGRFASRSGDVNTPILFPVSYIDAAVEDSGEGLAGHIYDAIPISSASDDVEEAINSGEMSLSDETLNITTLDAANTSIVSIASGLDDVRQLISSGAVWASKGIPSGAQYDSLVLGDTSTDDYIVGLRFADVPLPKGVTIKSAQITFTATSPDATANKKELTINIKGVDEGQMDGFELVTNGVSNLPKTTENIDWIISDPWYQDATYNSPELANIVQEIISNSDWQVGNALAFTFEKEPHDEDVWRRFVTFDEDPERAPTLRIVYEVPEGLTYEALYEQRITLDENDAFEFRPDNPAGSFNEYTSRGESPTSTPDGATWTDQIRLGTAYCLGTRPTGNSCRGESLVGLRFANLPVPKGATITEAKIEMTYRHTSNTKLEDEPLSLEIYVEDNANAAIFEVGDSSLKTISSAVVNSNLSQRTKTAKSVMWNNLPDEQHNLVITSPDLTDLVQDIVNKSDWEKSNNALAFLFERDQSVDWLNMSGQRGIHYVGLATTNDETNIPTKAAKLILKWEGVAEASQPVAQKVGLRFQYVDIPQGAKVTEAKLVFTSGLNDDTAGSVTIQGEKGNSAEFTSENGNLSSRELTTSQVDWTLDAWTEDNSYSSPYLTEIVQEIVNSSDWCGGTGGMTFIISPKAGSAMRNAQAFEFSKSNAPTLKVAYNINEINGSGCTLSTYSGRIIGTDDDVEETVIRDGSADGVMFIDSDTLEMTVDGSGTGKTQRIVGLRFQDVPIPKGTKATKAIIEFSADSATGGDGTLTIRGEKSADAGRFVGTTSELSNRPKTSASVSWELNEQNEWTKNQTFQTVDISNIINEITGQSGWEAYNNLVLFISGDTGLREAKSFDRSPAEAPVLRITVDGLLGDGTASNTVRTHLKKAVREMFIPSYSSTALVDALYESYLYYAGGEVNGGKDRLNNLHYRISHPASHTGTAYTPEGCDVNLDPYSEACAKEKISEAHAEYISPITSGCQANHVVLLTDGQPTKNTVAGRIGSDLKCYNGYPDGTDYYTLNTKDGSSNQDFICGPRLAEYMSSEDISDLEGFQNVMTHTVGLQLGNAWKTTDTGTKGTLVLDSAGNAQIDDELTTQNVQTARYMRYIAGMGGGDFYPAGSATQLLDAFKAIIAKAMTSSTSYATPSVSVSAFNRLFHRNEVYFSLFKPDFKQRWNGNVKKYLVCDGSDSASGCTIGDIIDANGNSAVANRYISPDARSFWSNDVDGEKVEKGGAGERGQNDLTYRVDEDTSRKIYTVFGDSNIDIIDDSNEIRTNNAAFTGLISDVSLIEWIRGKDVDDEDQDGITNENRWIYADPLHSSPAVMSYDASDNRTFLFVGTNDGLIRMINAKSGREEWAFLVPELIDKQAALRLNETGDRIYGVDASPTIWFNDSPKGTSGVVDSGDIVKVYFGMRRGGRTLYGLDVKNPNTPILDWKKTGGVDDGFEKLGQTWSAARPIIVNHKGKKKVVLMFGGGYDEVQDTEYSTSDIGNAVYMVDPKTGDILWSASNSGASLNLSEMQYAIPSDLAFMDVDGDGAMDRIYFGDMGGQVWRIDIAGIGDDYQGVGGVLGRFDDAKRRFFYPPEVLRVTDTIYSAEDQYDLVLITSGNRTHPLGTDVNDDQFYALRDYSLGTLPDINNDGQADAKNGDADTTFHTSVLSDLVDLTDNILQVGSADQQTAVIEDLQAGHGWYINLVAEAGEKGLASPVVLDGVVFFTTYSPPDLSADTACSVNSDGNSRLYALNIFTAGSAFNFDGEGTSDDLTTSDRSQMLREGITSDIVPMFINNQEDGTGEVRLLSNDLSLLGQGDGSGKPFATIAPIPTFWMQE